MTGPGGPRPGGKLAGRRVVITGASSGIGAGDRAAGRAAGGVPILVARRAEALEELRRPRSSAPAGRRGCTRATSPTTSRSTPLVKQLLADHDGIDMLVNNAGRSIRRSIKLSYDRFHDFERTMALNYFGAIRLILGLLPHMTERRFGHIVNVSSIGVQANPPRFSAYVASKAALDAFSRIVATETFGDGVTFTTIHMPLVRTPMIGPTTLYDAFPTISPEEAADMVIDALVEPAQGRSTRGSAPLGEVLHAVAPKVVDQVLHVAYRRVPRLGRGEGSGRRRAVRRPRSPAPPTRSCGCFPACTGSHGASDVVSRIGVPARTSDTRSAVQGSAVPGMSVMRVGTWCGSLGRGSANAAGARGGDRGAGRPGCRGRAHRRSGRDPGIPRRARRRGARAGRRIREAAIESVDGVLMAAPEYAGGLAGVVKNALDWLVGSGSLYHRLVGVMSTGTTGGEFAIEQLVRTVSWQGGLVVATLSIASPRTKQDEAGAFTDPATLTAIREWAATVVDAHDEPPSARLARVATIVAPLGIDPERFGDLT